MPENIGDIIQAMRTPFRDSAVKPVFIFIHQIHDWTKRFNNSKNRHLKYLSEPHVWKVSSVDEGSAPGLVYKDRHNDKSWVGADGVPGGRPVELFSAGAYPIPVLRS
jgi:hypothetical protein